MSKPVPIRLQKEPLLEAIWEIRFASDEPVRDMLPGMLYQALRNTQPVTVARLPSADIPRPIAQHDEGLRYLPTVRLEFSQNDPFIIQMGERLVTLNCRRPYPGWLAFSKRARELAQMLESTGLINHPERFSLKYIDLIELEAQPSLASLEASLSLAGHDLVNRPVQLRTEIHQAPFIHVLQVASPVDLVVAGAERHRGTLVDIDTIHPAGEDFWTTLEQRLNEAHSQSKQLFFDLLTDNAINQLEPIYEGQGE
jgi:uncharacterized protein (TIGR04255 family)